MTDRWQENDISLSFLVLEININNLTKRRDFFSSHGEYKFNKKIIKSFRTLKIGFVCFFSISTCSTDILTPGIRSEYWNNFRANDDNKNSGENLPTVFRINQLINWAHVEAPEGASRPDYLPFWWKPFPQNSQTKGLYPAWIRT